jgi:FtsP/CotA-like multicopper oxidase with cupredoxin domain
VAEVGEVEVAPGEVYRTWLYNGQFPGPEIRAREGERLRITVENRLPEGTTVHWHGVPVPNAMDGVPGLTQDPIPPGGSFLYDYVAEPSGSYLYHSHVGLQIDRGLVGPLVFEEATPHVAYDREHTLVLDDYLPGAPTPLAGGMGGRGMREGMMGGMRDRRGGEGRWREGEGRDWMGGEGRRGMMDGDGQIPPYAGLLVNGRLPEDPATFEVRRGERVRLRLLNPSGATTFRVAVAGHRMSVTHADARPVEPVPVDSLVIGMGERYDVVVEADNPGVWPIVAVTLEGDAPPARAVLRYTDAAGSTLREGTPEGLQGGRVLRYNDLQSVETLPPLRPDRNVDLLLSMRMMAWAINGQLYPDADPIVIEEGERVRFRMVNRSMMLHPMHLHGHFFRVGNALKDTVLVEPHMGRASFDFVADHPGRWLFHCHNIYHMEAGMTREVRYA